MALVVVVALVGGACGDDGGAGSSVPSDPQITVEEWDEESGEVLLRFEPVLVSGDLFFLRSLVDDDLLYWLQPASGVHPGAYGRLDPRSISISASAMSRTEAQLQVPPGSTRSEFEICVDEAFDRCIR